ncbi:MAG: hypothetical protein ACLR7U_05595 [Ruthenibacterium lactatiformans]
MRGAGGITSTAEYQIYGRAAWSLKRPSRRRCRAAEISDAAIDMLFEELRRSGQFEENAELRQLVEAYGAVSKSSCRGL